MHRFSLNIREKKKISSETCALAGVEAYTEQLELQNSSQRFPHDTVSGSLARQMQL